MVRELCVFMCWYVNVPYLKFLNYTEHDLNIKCSSGKASSDNT